MKHNIKIIKALYDMRGERVSLEELASWQVWLPPDKPITSSNGELILLEKFGRFLERLTGLAFPTLSSFDVELSTIDKWGHTYTAVYSLI